MQVTVAEPLHYTSTAHTTCNMLLLLLLLLLELALDAERPASSKSGPSSAMRCTKKLTRSCFGRTCT